MKTLLIQKSIAYCTGKSTHRNIINSDILAREEDVVPQITTDIVTKARNVSSLVAKIAHFFFFKMFCTHALHKGQGLSLDQIVVIFFL